MPGSSYKARSIRGMRDLLPQETERWAAVEAVARETFALYGFREIRTPIVEETELFVRSVGAGTDIVGKEMYTFPDRKGKSLSLRPESTASVARAFVEHGLKDTPLPVRWFYLGPHFRYERPQRGRYRQFHQIGAELIGDPGPWTDAEVIAMLFDFLQRLGFRDLEARLNTVGDKEARQAYGAALREALAPVADELSEDSRTRLEQNPLRILDSKSRRDQELLAGAPSLEGFLGDEDRQHFADLCAALDAVGVKYEVSSALVRGLDYYTRTVFEITSGDLGAQNTIVGGGRYDGLIAEVGGVETPAIGFAIGEDRLLELLEERQVEIGAESIEVSVVGVGDVAAMDLLRLCGELRDAGIAASAEAPGRSLKAAFRRAESRGLEWVVLLGEDELAHGRATVKNLGSGEQETVSRGEVARVLR